MRACINTVVYFPHKLPIIHTLQVADSLHTALMFIHLMIIPYVYFLSLSVCVSSIP